MVLPHENLHPFPLSGLGCVQGNQAVSQITPQFLLSGQATCSPEKAHRFNQTRPSRDQWGGWKGAQRGYALGMIWVIAVD